jgi:predicted ATPase
MKTSLKLQVSFSDKSEAGSDRSKRRGDDMSKFSGSSNGSLHSLPKNIMSNIDEASVSSNLSTLSITAATNLNMGRPGRLSKSREFSILAEREVSVTWKLPPGKLSSEEFTVNKLNLSELELYGRENEVAQLKVIFEDVQIKGAKAFIAITGYSGTGKSSLAQELRPSVVNSKGFFCVGKFDQQNRMGPYSAFAMAFSSLTDQILLRDATFVSTIKTKIVEACAGDEKSLVRVIPSLGKLLDVPDEDSTSDLNDGRSSQLQFAFRNLVRAVAGANHPLVLVLDDVQWVDEASLLIMDALLTHPKSCYFVLITTSRENETSEEHPFNQMVQSIEVKGIQVTHIAVGDLDKTALSNLTATILRSTPEVTRSLSEVVYSKTNGNAFFTLQFLKMLTESGLLAYNFGSLRWHWDVDGIKSMAATENVAELMKYTLRQRRRESQRVLQVAACLGPIFDVDTVEAVTESLVQSEKLEGSYEVRAILERSINEGLLERNGDTVSFVHDQIQAAALALDDGDENQESWARWHFRAGQRLLTTATRCELSERLFLAVDMCNKGASSIEETDRPQLAGFNLQAGRAAMKKGAFDSAEKYFKAGLDCLGVGLWSKYPDLALDLTSEMADSVYCSGKIESMEFYLEIVLSQDIPIDDKMRAYLTRIRSFGAQERFQEAVDATVSLLSEMGLCKVSPSPSIVTALSQLNKTKNLLKKHTPSSLGALPLMEDRRRIFAMGVIDAVAVAAYCSSPMLYVVLWTKAIRWCVKYGVCKYSPVAISVYGLLCCALLNDSQKGLMYGTYGSSEGWCFALQKN